MSTDTDHDDDELEQPDPVALSRQYTAGAHRGADPGSADDPVEIRRNALRHSGNFPTN